MRWVWVLVMGLAAHAWAAPYEAPNVIGRADASCLGAGNPYPCCTGPSVGNCIKDTDFTLHTEALERVDAILLSDATKTANYVLAGPTSGSAATPTWRAMVLADIPDDSTADKCLRSGGSGGDPAYEACSPIINVKDAPYLATGDGVTDDTTALQAAATACENAGGGVIYAPKGTYLAAQWTVGSNCTLRGDGIDVTTFKCAASETNLCILASDNGDKAVSGSNYGTAADNVRFEYFTLDGNDVARHAANPVCTGSTCYIRGLGTAHGSTQVVVERVRVTGGGSRAMEFSFTSDLWVRDSIVDDSSHVSGKEGDCIHVETECYATDQARNPPGWCDAGVVRVSNIWIRDNLIRRCGDVGIEASLSSNVHITNNTHLGWDYFGTTAPPDNPENGIHCAGCRDAEIRGNILRGIESPGILVDSREWLSTPYHGPQNVQIVGNELTFATGDRYTGWDAVSVIGTATDPALDIHVDGNTIRNAVRRPIRIGTETYDFTVTNNIITNGYLSGDGAADTGGIVISPSAGSPVARGSVANNSIQGAATKMGYCVLQQWGGSTNPGNIRILDNSCLDAVLGPISTSAAQRVFVRHMQGHSTTGNSLITSAMLNSGGVLQGAARGSEVWCSDCTYDATTGLCNTGGAGTLPYRPAFKADNTLGNWCCATGKGFTTCGSAIAAADLPATLTPTSLAFTATLFANLGTPANGSTVYCSDCTQTDPCAGSGTGALAKRLNGAWDCD